MSLGITLYLTLSDYAGFDNVSTTNVSLTAYQAQILLSVAVLLLERSAWEEMTDTQWDDLEVSISGAIGSLQDAT
jgi:hypothetical protein